MFEHESDHTSSRNYTGQRICCHHICTRYQWRSNRRVCQWCTVVRRSLYNWVEYKMSTGSGSDAMTIYYKYNKQTGKCSMRFEGAQQVQGMPTEMDCSSDRNRKGNKRSQSGQFGCPGLLFTY